MGLGRGSMFLEALLYPLIAFVFWIIAGIVHGEFECYLEMLPLALLTAFTYSFVYMIKWMLGVP